MNFIEVWFFQRIIRKEVRQGFHKQRIIKMYKTIANATKEEFTEDNKASLSSFLRECFDESSN